MKTESTVKYVLRLALTLLLITAVVAVALAGVNSVTAPKIAELNEQKTQKAIEAVLPGGGSEVAFTDDTGLVSTVYKGDAGYAVQVAPAGFGGTISMMVGTRLVSPKKDSLSRFSITSDTPKPLATATTIAKIGIMENTSE